MRVWMITSETYRTEILDDLCDLFDPVWDNPFIVVEHCCDEDFLCSFRRSSKCEEGY